ncbi:MAG TPA: biopolymer transporter ExbD [Gammaproteobacteria bacterium]|nr:biopolymer transporter ExbD [Gammaproteobacteria bacterium]
MRYVSRAARMGRRHKRRKQAPSLILVSLIDILSVLVFFLLVNSGDVQVLPNARNIELPASIADEQPREAVVVLITDDAVLVGGRTVARVSDLLASRNLIIPELKAALMSETNRAPGGNAKPDAANREVTIMGDKSIPYRVLKKVMATCTDADYGRVSLAVLHKSSDPKLASATQGT